MRRTWSTAPRLTIITPVSAWTISSILGDTVAAIAGEKAGIIKRGVPCIVGPQTDEGLAVIEATRRPPGRAAAGPRPALACVRGTRPADLSG